MKRRLRFEQKVQAVFIILVDALYEMSQYEIGKRIGYVNGTPIVDVVDWLCEEGLAICKEKSTNAGWGRYVMITQKGREYAQSIGLDISRRRS